MSAFVISWKLLVKAKTETGGTTDFQTEVKTTYITINAIFIYVIGVPGKEQGPRNCVKWKEKKINIWKYLVWTKSFCIGNECINVPFNNRKMLETNTQFNVLHFDASYQNLNDQMNESPVLLSINTVARFIK